MSLPARCILFGLLLAAVPLATGHPVPGAMAVPDYLAEVQPLFNRRCVACHGCLASPCNLKLDSYPGVTRGGLGQNPYGNHLLAVPRTDMDVASTVTEWRERGFYPVIPGKGSSADNAQASLLYQMIAAGHQHNRPGFSREALAPAYERRYRHQCPKDPQALRRHLEAEPLAGMPFGLPGLSAGELETLRAWADGGAPGPSREADRQARLPAGPEAVRRWERFLNDPDPRARLVARYIYEHVFLAHIVLDESPGDFFRLVRSSSPPARSVDDGQGGMREERLPVVLIDTPRPYDDPYAAAGVDRFYYRLQKLITPMVQKNHFVWHLDLTDIGRLRDLFLGSPWPAGGDLDPPWGVGNPFRVFGAIPALARYRFLLENSEVIVGAITYGPVCLGQVATYAVKDHFWVFFLDPGHDVSVLDPKLGLNTWETFMDRSVFGNAAYERAYAEALARLQPNGYTMDAIWDGDGDNPNAWLTILRHESNVSVMPGRQGGLPRTFWLMGYSGFERIYYDTVANYEYWSGDLPKLETLLFFNYLRQEFEDSFLLLLPERDRARVRRRWTRGIGALGLDLIPFAGEDQPAHTGAIGPDPLLDLVERIQHRLGPAISGPPDPLNPRVKPDPPASAPLRDYDDWVSAVAGLTVTTRYRFPRFLPSVTLVKLDHGSETRVYSLIANRVYASQDTLFFQNNTALPDEYTLSVYEGVVGGFPNLFMVLDISRARAFVETLKAVDSAEDWIALKHRYGVLRNSDRFWALYDWFNAANAQQRGIGAGILDLSYYDLFDSVY